MTVWLKMHAAGKIFGKICLKAIRDTFFPICGLWSGEWRGDSIFWCGVYATGGGSSNFLACMGACPKGGRVLGLLTVMILKSASESIFFQSNKFTACKFKDEKEVTNFLMVFNLLKIIHPSQGKKHLMTQWNLNCNPQEYLIGYW